MSRVGKSLIEPRSSKRESVVDDGPYKIYFMTFHGHYLDPVREQFIKEGRSGLRRRVIIIDFEDERNRLNRKGTFLTDFKKSGGAGDAPNDISDEQRSTEDDDMDVMLLLDILKRELQLHEEVTNTLQSERQFNLVDYWFETLRQGQTGRNRGSLAGRRSFENAKKLQQIKEANGGTPNIPCTKLKPQRHNRTGRPKPLNKKKYIEDEPETSKLFIVFVGSFDNHVFLSLLRFKQPVQGIFHFFPGPTQYEILVANPERKIFVENEMVILNESITELRSNNSTKPTGIFKNCIPFISQCRAERFARKIYDQLSWACYDADALYNNYRKYYVRPFREINVEIPNGVELKETLEYASHLFLQGNYLMQPLPGINSDRVTALLYLDMLFSTVDQSDGILTEWEMVLLSTPLPKRLYALYKDSVDALAERYADAFNSITKLRKTDRLFVEANNKTLTEMVGYVDHERFRHIYLACLEYKLMRKYLRNHYYRYGGDMSSMDDWTDGWYLPRYARLYPTEDGLIQRLLTLHDEYDFIDATNLEDNYILYRFKRSINEVTECNRVYYLPTCLCFRDFTIYQMDEFLQDLITPELMENATSSNLSEVERFELMMRRLAEDYNPDIFVRPKSLKASRVEVVSNLLSFKSTTRRATRRDSAREREMQMANEALMEITSNSGIGLPPDHRLLSGYNLDDIRQEIWVKTSKYFFEEGSLQLYEERWCFTDTNKNLNFKVNDVELILGTEKNDLSAVQSQLTLITKNDINMRLMDKGDECAKIILKYPNGLSVFYQENHVEQIWSGMEAPQYEKRRVMTPFSAVIIEYVHEDFITILRYNGEIYRLYQYEFNFLEEEGDESSNLSDRSIDRGTMTSTNLRILMSTVRRDADPTAAAIAASGIDRRRIPKEARLNRRVQHTMPTPSTKKRNARQRGQTQAQPPSQDAQSVSIETNTFSTGQIFGNSDQEKENISYELEFLKKIMKIYGISYKHLIITTSEGRVFNLMINGNCYETFSKFYDEWHDYFANESYTSREDGTRMIWGSNYLKCYHADGTVLETITEDIYHIFEEPEEKEGVNVISQSSSHAGFDDSSGDYSRKLPPPQGQPPPEEPSQLAQSPAQAAPTSQPSNGPRRSTNRKKKLKTYEPYLKTVGEVEEEGGERIPDDPGYVLSNITSESIYHANYASVHFLPLLVMPDSVFFTMEIRGIDGIRCTRVKEQVINKYTDSWRSSNYDMSMENEENYTIPDASAAGDAPMMGSIYDADHQIRSSQSLERDHLTGSFISDTQKAHFASPRPSRQRKSILVTPKLIQAALETVSEVETNGVKFDEEIFHDVTKIWVGNDFLLNLAEDYFEFFIVVDRIDPYRGTRREKLEFRFSYFDYLPDIFRKIVARISSFKKYNQPKVEEVFFLEKDSDECDAKGLEFMDELPKLGEYNKSVSNTVTELSNLLNIMDRLANHYDWYDKDMAKFPRFHVRCRKPHLLDTFPMVLDANLFLKVPRQLSSIDRIHLFAEPLDGVNFKKTRSQIKETMSCYTQPHIAREVHALFSHNNWRQHLEEQERRRLIETQRTGLYQAILRHKRFPNYFLFTEKYQGKAKFIDYFDFCIHECVPKDPAPQKSARTSARKIAHSKLGSKSFSPNATTPADQNRSLSFAAENGSLTAIEGN